MRISDWSSDVCSSDLLDRNSRQISPAKSKAPGRCPGGRDCYKVGKRRPLCNGSQGPWKVSRVRCIRKRRGSQQTEDRKSVGWGTSVSVRVDLGGRRIIKKQKQREE